MLRMVKTLLLRQPTTFCVTLMLSAREIGLENGRPLFVLDPLVPEPTPVSGDEDRDRCSPRLPFDEADLQFHIKTHTKKRQEKMKFYLCRRKLFHTCHVNCYAHGLCHQIKTQQGPVYFISFWATFSHRENRIFISDTPCRSIKMRFANTLSRQ